MLIGDRIRAIREAKNLSQDDIEKRCGLLRAYLSRVEHGHTVPSVETLEKFGRALEIPLYQLFYEGEEQPKFLRVRERKTAEGLPFGGSKKETRFPENFRRVLPGIKARPTTAAPHGAEHGGSIGCESPS